MPMDWNTVLMADRRDPSLSREGAAAIKDAFSYVIPTSPEEAALSMMLGPFGRPAKLAGTAALSAAYSPDAEAGWLMGLKGAKKAGLDEIVRMLTEERKAAKALSNRNPIVQASGQSGVWTGFGGEPRTFFPNLTDDWNFKTPLVPGNNFKISDLVNVPSELLDAYPKQFRDIKVRSNPMFGHGAGTIPEEGLIEMGLSPWRPTGLLAHEITHAIPQYVEGFPGGSSPNVAKGFIDAYRKLEQKAKRLKAPDKISEIEALMRENPAHQFKTINGYLNANDLYRANAGEVEASMMDDLFIEKVLPKDVSKYLPKPFWQSNLWDRNPQTYGETW